MFLAYSLEKLIFMGLVVFTQEKGGALIMNFGMPARDLLSHCHQWVDWWYIFHKATVNR
jgi:hypothetical protein